MKVEGSVSPGYEPVRDLFESNFKRGREANAQCCAYVAGKKVVDLWGSASDDPNYNGDSLQVDKSQYMCMYEYVLTN